MQSELRSDENCTTLEGSSIMERKALSKDEDLFSQIPETGAVTAPLASREEGEKSGEIRQTLQTSIRWENRKQKTLSAVWQLILISGDIVLMVVLLGVVWDLMVVLHLLPQIYINIINIRKMTLMWMFLGLLSWILTISATPSQNLSYVSSRFKNLYDAFFKLVLMNICWGILSYLFLAIQIMTLVWLGVFFLLLAVPVFAIWRVLFAEIRNLSCFRPRAVIVGINPVGQAVAQEIQSLKRPIAHIKGFIDEDGREQSPEHVLPVLGGKSELRYLVCNDLIDMIIIALDYSAPPALFKEAIDAAQYGVSVLPMTVIYESSTGKALVEYISDPWHTIVQTERVLPPLYVCWKKALDLLCGCCGLLLLCAVLPVIALFIYLDSPGPIFYSQVRVGLRGKLFRIYKFRSMYTDAENKGRAMWAAEYDTRVTRVGRFLRATHLDELPQLLNILRGDMSLIGPRPERAEFVAKLEEINPFYRYRLTVKPGLTGWAQVKYRYTRTGDDAVVKLQYDLYYIKWQSFRLDLFILLKTVAEVLSLRGT